MFKKEIDEIYELCKRVANEVPTANASFNYSIYGMSVCGLKRKEDVSLPEGKFKWDLYQSVSFDPFYEKEMLHTEELDGESFVMREQGSGTRQLFEDYVNRHHISIKVTWEANCPRTIINAVIWNKVLSVMSLRLLTHELAHEKIRVFYDEKQEWNRKFKLVYHKNKFLTPAIYELEKILYQHKEMKLPKEYGILAHE